MIIKWISNYEITSPKLVKPVEKNRRELSSEHIRNMVRAREARRAFKKFYAQCFWSFDPLDLAINKILTVVRQIAQNKLISCHIDN